MLLKYLAYMTDSQHSKQCPEHFQTIFYHCKRKINWRVNSKCSCYPENNSAVETQLLKLKCHWLICVWIWPFVPRWEQTSVQVRLEWLLMEPEDICMIQRLRPTNPTTRPPSACRWEPTKEPARLKSTPVWILPLLLWSILSFLQSSLIKQFHIQCILKCKWQHNDYPLHNLSLERFKTVFLSCQVVF